MVKKISKDLLKSKKLIIFDLDGTLTESKAPMDEKTSALLSGLLKKKMVAIIGGGKYEQFQKQFLPYLRASKEELKRLFLFPTNSTAFYRLSGSTWKRIYHRDLSRQEKKKIFDAFDVTFKKHNYKHPKNIYGVLIEDRGSQVSFSAHGQLAPMKVKEMWNKTKDVRPQLMKTLSKLLPQFEVRRGGLTTIDVTRKGIDKAYGVRQIQKALGIQIKDMLFIGDALYPGGNDYAAEKTGVECIQVSGPKETHRIIKLLMNS